MTTRRTRDPTGLLNDRVHITLDGDPGDFAALAALLDANTPEARINRLRQHPELSERADELAALLRNGDADARTLEMIAQAETKALYLQAAPVAIRDTSRQRGSKTGGKNAGQAARIRAAQWQADCVERANGMLGAGKQPYELASILATRFDRTPRQVRTVLQRAGLLSARKCELTARKATEKTK